MFGINRSLDGLIHLAVARASAKIPAKRGANLLLRRLRIFSQQMLDGHDKSWSAIATLRSAPIAIGFLNGGKASMLTHTLDRRNFLSLTTGGQQCARHHGDTVNQHSACAAGGVVAAAFGSGELDILTKHIEQQFAGLEGELMRAAVDP